ncbi:DUF2726 domain-containing protein [Deinococcus detaillensis]|uniref:DUF2726 domain-containing protein n=1 Tax=Deinococcus detaillensis TaxID=2592048 RepID=A0A553V3N5_9DEIO|nr:DUF2726 domain-containing protein [Deinococcus detaillensis]TSA87090.1 DUF2726 domain-containing protein [Deinococcus detaillensis]
MEFLALLLLAAVIWFVAWFRRKAARKPQPRKRLRSAPSGKVAAVRTTAGGTTAEGSQIPASFPVQAKQYFFSRSEGQFYETLLEALQGGPYIAFPNVRLNDLMMIKASGGERQAVLGRLRDKHVDFLIVARAQYRPVLGIELDGASHENDQQQYRDAVKDTLFASARLPLLRLDARRLYRPAELSKLLKSALT